jgi:hypothetical protein
MVQYPASVPDSDSEYKMNLYRAGQLHSRHYLDLLIAGVGLTWDTVPKNHQFGFLPQNAPADEVVDEIDEIIDSDQAPPVTVSEALACEVVALVRKTRATVSARPDASPVSSLLAFEEMDDISSDDSDSDFEEGSALEKVERVQIDDSDDDFVQGPPRKRVRREQIDDSDSDDDFMQEQPRKRVKREQTDSSDKDFVCKYKVIKVEVGQSDDEQDDSLDDHSFPDFLTMPN